MLFGPGNSTGFTAAALAFPLALSVAAMASAAVRLPGLFTDNMVLQRDMPLPFWGWADAGEKVTVTAGSHSQSTTTGVDCRWSLTLDAMQVGPAFTVTVRGSNTITLNNVLVGEVWLCSGQSNMELGMQYAHNAATEIPAANHPDIRLYWVPRTASAFPQDDVAPAIEHLHPRSRSWQICTPDGLTYGGGEKGFSAVAYFFGRDLHDALGVPIGLIHASWGGTPAQAWTSEEGLKSSPEFADDVERIDALHADYKSLEAKYENETIPQWQAALAKWNADHAADIKAAHDAADAAHAAGKPYPPPYPIPRELWKPLPPGGDPHFPTTLFNGSIHPLIPFAIRGVIWYQGESNANQAVQYRTLFPALIDDWRKDWGEGNIPFIWVQLANYLQPQRDPNDKSNWAMLREAQSMTLRRPNTAQAVIIDLGQADNIHPKDKADVGHRLMLAAEHVAYGKDLIYSGPTFDRMEIQGSSIRLHFNNVGGGLAILAAPATQPSVPQAAPVDHLKGFAIAGDNRHFAWADAKIDGDSIVVSSAAVSNPVAVRYAWGNNPPANLYNKEGLPASPFRTDDWIALTTQP